MPVDSKHSSLSEYATIYQEIDTILAGEDKVKLNSSFVPKLSGQDPTEYRAYRNRGLFFNATATTVSIMTGSAMRKRPIIEAPENMLESLKSCTQNGESIEQVIQEQYNQNISFARYGVLVDYSKEQKLPYLSLYDKDSIINWNEGLVEGKIRLTMLVLKEIVTTVSPEDRFKTIQQDQYRHFFLDDDGYLQVDTYIEDTLSNLNNRIYLKDTNSIATPINKGKRLNYIPFVIFTPDGLSMSPKKPPIYDLVKLNIAHWRNSVDFFHGLHYCAIPTAWASGFGKDTILKVGGTTAWVTEDVGGKCGYLEFTGQGLNPLKEALEHIETLMAIAGTRLIEHSKKTIERAETLRIRSSGDSATLSSIANTAEKGFLKVLQYYGEWMGVNPSQISIALNKDFLDVELDSSQLIALLKAVQLGEISQDTFLHNLMIGEILPEGISVEVEKERIKKDISERQDLINRVMAEKGITITEEDSYMQDDYEFMNGKGQVSKAVDKDIRENV